MIWVLKMILAMGLSLGASLLFFRLWGGGIDHIVTYVSKHFGKRPEKKS